MAAAAPTAAPVPHIDPVIVQAAAPPNPKLFGDHDLEDPSAPEWVSITNSAPAASGTAALRATGTPRLHRMVIAYWQTDRRV